MRWVWCGIVALVVAGALSGCPAPLAPGTTPDPARLDLQLRLRPSCGFDTSVYDTTCLDSILVRVKNKDGDELQRGCTKLDSRPGNIQDLVFADEPQLAFGTLTSQGEVSFEVIGLHDIGTSAADAGAPDLCATFDDDDFSTWLFFGESQVFDLGTLAWPDGGDRVVVEVPVDCRDCDDGCLSLGEPTCPTNPISFCVPGSASLTCEKPCSDNSQCFEGELRCDEDRQRCDDNTGIAGQFCSPCTSDGDCEVNEGFFCVGLPGEQTGLCAQRCPRNRCLTGTKCNRLGNRLRRITTEAATDGPEDAGTDAG